MLYVYMKFSLICAEIDMEKVNYEVDVKGSDMAQCGFY
jgi:hypothetical protein